MGQKSFILDVCCTRVFACRGEHRSPAKKHKETFFIVLFSDEKYQKSFKRIFHPLKKLLPRARVGRASRAWQVRAAKDKAKVGGFALPATSYYHVCEHSARESRADSCTHCLHARIYRCGGRGSDTYADGTIKINPISLCSHPDMHPNLNREVRHSPTWHSSKSESALERFESVAVVQQLPDGRGSVFAPVAARRRKVLKEESFPLFVLFVLFGQAKRTLKEKNHKDTFLLSYFCMTKSTKSHQRELSPLFESSSRVHELVARSSAWQVRAARDKSKVGGFTALHGFSYTTRANIAHEKAEQIRARIVCTPAESAWRAWV